jgi:hypothetical protein
MAAAARPVPSGFSSYDRRDDAETAERHIVKRRLARGYSNP